MKEKFDYLIKKYNSQLKTFPNNPNEVYKWEALQHFQENWNENAVDFYVMFNEAFKKKANLVYQNSFGFLDQLGKTYPDKLQHFFQLIFENKTSSFYDILEKGKKYADDLIPNLKDKLGKEVLNHQFDERTLSFLLFLRYPETNTLFKADVYEQLCSFLEVGQEEKKYDHFIALLTQLAVQAENAISLEQRNKFVPKDFNSPLLLAQDIVYQTLISIPKNVFFRTINILPQQNVKVFYDFLDAIISELTLENTYNQVFSVTNDSLKYHIGKRICLALEKEGFVFITDKQTTLTLKREDFTNPDNAFLYYNSSIKILLSNKEVIINAIREELKSDRETYRKNYDNAFFRKSVFNKKYRAKMFDDLELITFTSLDQLVTKVNTDLGNFCRVFQTKRKELLGKKKMNSAKQLFVYNDSSRDWAINEGGGTELQYHLYFRDTEIGYGLGFNAQYVPFANEMSPQDFMRPFALSYLNQPLVQSDLQRNGFQFIYGSKERLANLQLNDYILIGKTKNCLWNEDTNTYEISSYIYQEMLEELKGIIFNNYIAIIEQRNNFTTYNPMMEKNTALLKYKKQIILQGPPGTGKTKLAKEIAKNIIGSKEVEITKNWISKKITINQKIQGRNNQFEVIAIDDQGITLKTYKSREEGWKASFDKIIESFENKLFEDTSRSGRGSYEDAVALFINEEIKSEDSIEANQFKLIQFHPSYTYEDFVRGIVAKPNPDGEGILYEAENKTLGTFAREALRNYKSSNNNSTESNIEIWIDSNFEDFKNEIEKEVEEKELRLSGDITLFKVENESFRYGKDWAITSRINFRDFKNLIKAIVEKKLMLSNQQISKELSVHAHYRYTYYNALLKKFFENYEYQGESYSEPPKNYVLIIDEINRANLSSVLGELIYALEYRDEAVESMYDVDGHELILPPNLYIIGTMNTADRSVGHIDYAIRRRFAFVDVPAENLKKTQGLDNFDDVLFEKVSALFDTNLSPEFEKKDVQLGHSYFIDKTEEGGSMSIRLEYEIKPILLEYVKDGVLIGNNIIKEIEDLTPSI